MTPCPISKSIIRAQLRHVRRLYRAWLVLSASQGHPAVRGYDHQKEARIVEYEIKKAVIAYMRWSGRHGQGREACAVRLGLTYTTLGTWAREWTEGGLNPTGRGRPARLSTPREQAAVKKTLSDCGPATGIPALTALFPGIARREMAHIISAYRADYWEKHNLIRCLDWLVPGAVWAMDFTDTDPSRPIDGIYHHLLVVRDLGSGKLLLSMPVTRESAEAVYQALISLFKVYGPPVVIKSDNGSPFKSHLVEDLLWRNSVTFLLNPPYSPQYNGACEAGIGSLKVRAHHIAARNNRPGEWTCDDVEQARLQANRTARPKGRSGPVPEEAWQKRQPVTQDMRVDFIMAVHWHRPVVQKEEGVLELWKADEQTREGVEREAIERALVAHGFLLVGRRRIPTPFSSLFGSIIS